MSSLSPKPAPASGRGGAFVPMLAAAALGCAFAVAMFGRDYLFGVSPFWLWPAGDPALYLTAALYYLRGPWHLPLFAMPALGYPEGGSVILSDAIPLAAVAAKAVYSATGVPINYLAAWPLVAYALQGVMAVRFVRAMGERSAWVNVCLALWVLLLWGFGSRFAHHALMSHFVLLWALALYVEQTSRREPAVIEQIAALLISALINPYLCGMVAALAAATYATLWKDGLVTPAHLRRGSAAGFASLVVLAIAGYFTRTPGALASQEVGFYTWNPASLVVPPSNGAWPGTMTADVVRNVTGGQYEGESYLGLGPLAVGLLCVLTSPVLVWQTIRRHWILGICLIACVALAAGPRVYVASWLVMDLHLPAILQRALGIFRSEGRFIWPAMYVLTLVPAVLLLRTRYRRLIAVCVLLATGLQIVEAVPMVAWCRSGVAVAPPVLLDVPRLTALLSMHERLWVYPSWWCGGGQSSPVEEHDRELQLQVLAARLNIPTNSAYTARPLKNCKREQEWRQQAPILQPGTLYLFTRGTEASAPPVAGDPIDPARCRDLGWAVACSTQPLNAVPGLAPPRTWFVP
jgi:hypothetical protein